MASAYSREKLVNAVIYFAKNTNKLGKTKLMKLLFFLDFKHFKETARPVTNLEYFAWDRGPVPKDFFFEISGTKLPEDLAGAISIQGSGDFQKISTKIGVKPNMDYFSPREARILEEIAFVYRDVDAENISEISHLKNEPWEKTLTEKGPKAHIDYFLAIDNDSKSLPLEVAKIRNSHLVEMQRILGER